MKWIAKDVELLEQSKEYIDTVVLPLLPVSFEDEMKQSARMSDFISILCMGIERQFKGRLLLLPGFTYLKSMEEENLVQHLQAWDKELHTQGFKHVFYVTSDNLWKGVEDKYEGDCIWLPSLPLEEMDENARNTILDDQVKQLLQLFMQKWQNQEKKDT